MFSNPGRAEYLSILGHFFLFLWSQVVVLFRWTTMVYHTEGSEIQRSRKYQNEDDVPQPLFRRPAPQDWPSARRTVSILALIALYVPLSTACHIPAS